jgi:hypothetical protein
VALLQQGDIIGHGTKREMTVVRVGRATESSKRNVTMTDGYARTWGASTTIVVTRPVRAGRITDVQSDARASDLTVAKARLSALAQFDEDVLDAPVEVCYCFTSTGVPCRLEDSVIDITVTRNR